MTARPERPAGPAPGDVRAVYLILTSGCNLSCSYCYQTDKKPGRMEWDVLRGGLDLALGSNRNEVEIYFYGGEPLLQIDSIRRAVDYVERREPPGKRIRFAMVTNGTLLRGETLEFVVGKGIRVHLSFDGRPDVQDLRGRGTFAGLHRLLGELRTGHPAFFRNHLDVSLTVVPATVPRLADSVEYFLEEEVPGFGVSAGTTVEADWNREDLGVLDEQFARIYRRVLDVARQTGRVPFQPFRKTQRGPSRRERYSDLRMCGVIDGDEPAVDVDGSLHGCVTFAPSYQTLPAFLGERVKTLSLGRPGDGPYGERLPAYRNAVRAAGIFGGKEKKYSSYRACRDCEYIHSCTVCPMSIGRLPGRDDPDRVPDFLCAFNMTLLKYRDRFPTLRELTATEDPLERLRRFVTAVRSGS